MTKQEEIREGIQGVLEQMNTEVSLSSGRVYEYYIDKILQHLHSCDVAILTKEKDAIIAVEPLIKEEK